MSPVRVLTLLAIAAFLPCTPALECQYGKIQTVRNTSELPLTWTSGTETCEPDEGCQDQMMLIENGPQILLVIVKGCVKAVDQEPRVTWHRKGPGLSIVSYTRVCHHSDFCNDMSSTEVLGDLSTPTVPGTGRCPHCLSTRDCDDAPEEVCPAGLSHCYKGVLRLRGEDITSNLRVQGCVPEPGCNLLSGTQKIGIMDVTENCDVQLGSQALECKSGSLETTRNVSELPLFWTTGWKTCQIGEGCYETVMLTQNGGEFHMVLSKGCTRVINKTPQITRHRTGPGISIISYTHVCRHEDFCNGLSTTEPIWIPPPVTVPGTLRCPHCLSPHGCDNAPEKVCPAGTHCYSGILKLRGGSIAINLKVQGCIPQAGCDLLNGTQTIGDIDVSETCKPESVSKTLKCQHGTLETLRETSELPLQWTAGQVTCEVNEGCQDTLMLVENGKQVILVLIKGCTDTQDHEARVTEHRTRPGLSVISYTRVCRQEDLCNDLSTTAPLWAPPPATAPGTLSCPHCLSPDACEDPPKEVCPAGSMACYSGILRLRGKDSVTSMRVQGCMPQPGCNLLNGTQKIGPMDVSENCHPQLGTMTCHRGVMLKFSSNLADEAVEWTASGIQECEAGEVCQETLLLIDVGPKAILVGSKGCSGAGEQNAMGVSIYSRPPGMVVASYARFCNSDRCNRASSSSVLLGSLPHPGVPRPGNLRCPVCAQIGSCSGNTNFITCPQGTTRCYNGDIELKGGGLSATMSIQGCMMSSSKSLLGNSKTIGIFSAKEILKDRYNEPRLSGAASVSHLAWMLGLGLSLALLCGGLGPL